MSILTTTDISTKDLYAAKIHLNWSVLDPKQDANELHDILVAKLRALVDYDKKSMDKTYSSPKLWKRFVLTRNYKLSFNFYSQISHNTNGVWQWALYDRNLVNSNKQNAVDYLYCYINFCPYELLVDNIRII